MMTAFAAVAILGGGYIGSQIMYFSGRSREWITILDQSALPWLSLAVLAAAVVLAFVPDRDEREEGDEK